MPDPRRPLDPTDPEAYFSSLEASWDSAAAAPVEDRKKRLPTGPSEPSDPGLLGRFVYSADTPARNLVGEAGMGINALLRKTGASRALRRAGLQDQLDVASWEKETKRNQAKLAARKNRGRGTELADEAAIGLGNLVGTAALYEGAGGALRTVGAPLLARAAPKLAERLSAGQEALRAARTAEGLTRAQRVGVGLVQAGTRLPSVVAAGAPIDVARALGHPEDSFSGMLGMENADPITRAALELGGSTAMVGGLESLGVAGREALRGTALERGLKAITKGGKASRAARAASKEPRLANQAAEEAALAAEDVAPPVVPERSPTAASSDMASQADDLEAEAARLEESVKSPAQKKREARKKTLDQAATLREQAAEMRARARRRALQEERLGLETGVGAATDAIDVAAGRAPQDRTVALPGQPETPPLIPSVPTIAGRRVLRSGEWEKPYQELFNYLDEPGRTDLTPAEATRLVNERNRRIPPELDANARLGAAAASQEPTPLDPIEAAFRAGQQPEPVIQSVPASKGRRSEAAPGSSEDWLNTVDPIRSLRGQGSVSGAPREPVPNPSMDEIALAMDQAGRPDLAAEPGAPAPVSPEAGGPSLDQVVQQTEGADVLDQALRNQGTPPVEPDWIDQVDRAVGPGEPYKPGWLHQIDEAGRPVPAWLDRVDQVAERPGAPPRPLAQILQREDASTLDRAVQQTEDANTLDQVLRSDARRLVPEEPQVAPKAGVRLTDRTQNERGQDVLSFETPDGPVQAVVKQGESGALTIDWIGRENVQDATPNLGARGVRQLLRQVADEFPDATSVRFERISGSRYGPAAQPGIDVQAVHEVPLRRGGRLVPEAADVAPGTTITPEAPTGRGSGVIVPETGSQGATMADLEESVNSLNALDDAYAGWSHKRDRAGAPYAKIAAEAVNLDDPAMRYAIDRYRETERAMDRGQKEIDGYPIEDWLDNEHNNLSDIAANQVGVKGYYSAGILGNAVLERDAQRAVAQAEQAAIDAVRTAGDRTFRRTKNGWREVGKSGGLKGRTLTDAQVQEFQRAAEDPVYAQHRETAKAIEDPVVLTERAGQLWRKARQLTESVSDAAHLANKQAGAYLDELTARGLPHPDLQGAVPPEMVAALARSGLGAAIGFTQGDTPEERVRNALVGSAMLLGAPALWRAVERSRAVADEVIEAAKRDPRQPAPSMQPIAESYGAKYREIHGLRDFSIGGPYESVPLDEAYVLADLMDRMPGDATNPKVAASYEALKREVLDQYNHLVENGITFEPYLGGGEPYASSTEAIRDLEQNKHLFFFPTEGGFGNETGAVDPFNPASLDANVHPLLAPSGVKINGTELPYNDLFRAVHDVMGHGVDGNQFGPRGEHNAWIAHARMFSEEARMALALETRTQNSWVNYGPHLRRADGTVPVRGDADFIPLQDRPFADQKVFELPDWLIHPPGTEAHARARAALDQPLIEGTRRFLRNALGIVDNEIGAVGDVGQAKVAHGLVADMVVDAPEAPRLPKGTPRLARKFGSRKSVENSLETLDRVSATHPRTDTEEAFNRLQADALGTRKVPVPPYQFIRYVRDPELIVQKMSQITRSQLARKREGMDAALQIGQLYANGKANPLHTAKLLLWGSLSKQLTPYVQEAAFLDAIESGVEPYLQAAIEGRFDREMLGHMKPSPNGEGRVVDLRRSRPDSFLVWARGAFPAASPARGAQSNLNGFGEQLLLKMSQRGKDGLTGIERAHNLLADPGLSSKDARRLFLQEPSVGIDAKVFSFIQLLTGRRDVMVLDRVQVDHLWNDGRYDGYPLYGGQKGILGSGLSGLLTGPKALLYYETMERQLRDILPSVYERLRARNPAYAELSDGLEDVGDFHWESWVLQSQQEVDHATASGIARELNGDPFPYRMLSVRNGKYDTYGSMAEYLRDEHGAPMVRYPLSDGGVVELDASSFREAMRTLGSDAKRANPKYGVFPRGFKVTETASGAERVAPWFEDDRVNRARLDEFVRNWATGTLPAAGEGAASAGGRSARKRTVAGAALAASLAPKALFGATVGGAAASQDDESSIPLGMILGAGLALGVGGRAIYRAGGPAVVLDGLVQGSKNAAKVAGRLIRSRGDLPEEVFRSKQLNQGWASGQALQARNAIREFESAAKKVYGSLDVIPDGDIEAFDLVLKGVRPPSTIHPELRGPIAEARAHIDQLSDELIRRGVVQGPMALTIDANKGMYVRRSYRIHTDPEWAQNVPQSVKNNAIAYLQKENPQATPHEIDLMIEHLLKLDEPGQNPIAFLNSKLGRQDLKILNRRKDIAPEIRALWGEHGDFRTNYAQSVAGMTQILSNRQILEDAKQAGLGRYFWKDDDPARPLGLKKFSSEGNKALAPLDGYHAPPEIVDAFNRTFGADASHGDLYRALASISAGTKIAKTSLSPGSMIRNLISNTGFVVANGHLAPELTGGLLGAAAGTTVAPEDRKSEGAIYGFLAGAALTNRGMRRFRQPMQGFGPAFKMVMDHLGYMESPQFQPIYQRLLELGVVDSNVQQGELRQFLRQSGKKGFLNTLMGGDSGAGKLLSEAGKVYGGLDDVWKVWAYHNELARYEKVLTNLTRPELEEMAAQRVIGTLPNYSMVPEGVKRIQKIPLLGTFSSFPAEVVRVGKNAIGYAMEDLKRPETRAIGAQRLAGLLAAGLGLSAASAATRYLAGVSKDQETAMRTFMAPWDRYSRMLHLGSDERGRPRFVNLAYSDPWSYLIDPIMAALSDQPWEQKLQDVAEQLGTPFLGESFVTERVVDALRNKTVSNAEVYRDSDSPLTKVAKSVGHVGGALVPGAYTSFDRLRKGATGELGKNARAYDFSDEATALATGQRKQSLDVRQSMIFRGRELLQKYNEAGNDVRDELRNQGNVSASDLRDAYRTSEERRRYHFDLMHRMVEDAQKVGVSRSEVLKILKDSGVTSTLAHQILANDYRPYKPEGTYYGQTLRRAKMQAGSGPDAKQNLGTYRGSLRDRRALVNQLYREERSKQ